MVAKSSGYANLNGDVDEVALYQSLLSVEPSPGALLRRDRRRGRSNGFSLHACRRFHDGHDAELSRV